MVTAMSDVGVVYVTLPHNDLDRLAALVADHQGQMHGPAMRIPAGIEQGIEVPSSFIKDCIANLRNSGFTIHGWSAGMDSPLGGVPLPKPVGAR